MAANRPQPHAACSRPVGRRRLMTLKAFNMLDNQTINSQVMSKNKLINPPINMSNNQTINFNMKMSNKHRKNFKLKMPNIQMMSFLLVIVLLAVPAIVEARAGPEPKAKAQNEAENYNEYNEYGEEYG
jgi:hypothetical protein